MMRPRTLVTRESCRACGSQALEPVLSLGQQRLAGAFESQLERQVPLELVRCDPARSENGCGLVQLRHTVPSDLLYRSYSYRSGINQTMTENLHEIARQAEQIVDLLRGDLVLDVGCNDGTLLSGYETSGIERVGFEPSPLGEHAAAKGHKVIRDYYSAGALHSRWAKVITTIAMLYDLEDPAGFVADGERALAPDGVWVIECHYLSAMLESGGFDAVCHEHLAYYSLAVLERLLDGAGLQVVRAQRNGVNGGSIRLFVRRQRYAPSVEDAAGLESLRAEEFELGLDTPEPYKRFSDHVSRITDDLRETCQRLVDEGNTIHVYGASTKGNTILQHCGLGRETIPFAADRNPAKHGAQTATGIPIISEQDSRVLEPDYYLALPWHFLDEFVDRERAFIEHGGRFIVPLPEVHLAPEPGTEANPIVVAIEGGA